MCVRNAAARVLNTRRIPIAPGKKGKIKITFLPQGRPGSLNKTATVYTNGKPGKVVLQIKGRVAPKNKK